MTEYKNLLRDQERLDETLISVDRQIAINPHAPQSYFNRGNTLKQLKRLEEALVFYERAIALKSDYPEALNQRGNVLRELKRFEEARASYDRAIALRPDFAVALHNCGNTLRDSSRVDEALTYYDRALSLKADWADAHNSRGVALQMLGRHEDALASYRQAIAYKPDHVESLNNLGNTLLELKRPNEALASYDQAITVKPDCAEALLNRGLAFETLKRWDEALASYERAIALRSDWPEPYNSQGVALQALGRWDDALVSYKRTIALKPNHVKAHSNLGNTLVELNRLDEALAAYDRALTFEPNQASVKWNRGLCKLLAGQFEGGWVDYESRWDSPTFPSKRPAIEAPTWLGEDLSGRRIIVFAEQGMGDVIQFARYLTLLLDSGATVTLLTTARLVRLLRSLVCKVELVTAVNESETYDFQCALLSLPLRFKTNLSSIPQSVPYLAAEDNLVARWSDKIGREGFKIGINWQGNPRARTDQGRSIPLAEFLPLLRLPGARFVSLQKNDGTDQLAGLPPDCTIEELGDFDSGPDGFVDTAAVMQNLDLIVTSDTSIAHLAGALGRPVWVALKHVPDWRWMLNRNDSPWYPTMRLFRQTQQGDWKSAFASMETELRSLIKARDCDEQQRPVRSSPALSAELQPALNLYKARRYAEAEAVCRELLRVQPRHFDGTRLLAMLCCARADYGEAVRLLDLSLEINPNSALAHHERGNALRQVNRSNEALASFEKAILIKPNYVAAMISRANVLKQLGRLEEALTCYEKAIALEPTNAEAFNKRGVLFAELKQLENALASFDRVIALKPDYAAAYNNKGNVLRELKQPHEALQQFDRAVAIKPDYIDAHNNRCLALIELNRLEEALASSDRAMQNSGNAEALNNRGNVLHAMKRPEEALAVYDRAIALKPNSAVAFYNRGNLLKDLSRFDEALASFDRAIAINPRFAEVFSNRGNTLFELSRLEEAVASYDQALALQPNQASVKWNRGLCKLLAGQFEDGWADYEWRWDSPKSANVPSKRPTIEAPTWLDEDLNGKRILVFIEQGMGDVIQFARYLPLLANRGAIVTLLANARLVRLLRSLAGKIELITGVKEGETYDFQCALLSLPLRFKTSLSSIPQSVPYLAAEDGLVARWNAKIGGEGFKIGINWQGNPRARTDRGRSIPLAEFQPLFRLPGVRLVSLQKDDGMDQLADLPPDCRIEELGDFDSGPDGFVDTAAVMQNLDLIVTSDTSIAHLAGALGRPVWVALKHVPDWRWMLNRDDSPWYPTMRLFRQPQQGDWKSVFASMRAQLGEIANGKGP